MEATNMNSPTEHWTDKDWNKFSTWLKGILKVSDAKVTFTKKDGTERIMRCTLDPKQLPPAPVTEGEVKKERKVNDDVVAVYDLEAQGWRSFTLKSVKSVALSIG
jgi:hypothetical protein